MDILAVLAQEQEKSEAQTLKRDDNDYIHHTVMRVALEELGLDEETIEDVLFEPQDKWDYYLEYFTNKNKEEKK